jgi:hypothetical protein
MTGGGGSLAISAIMRLHGAAVPLHRWRASGADVFVRESPTASSARDKLAPLSQRQMPAKPQYRLVAEL